MEEVKREKEEFIDRVKNLSNGFQSFPHNPMQGAFVSPNSNPLNKNRATKTEPEV